ncbi:MAG TPA: hypothetical protein DEV93_13360 [Chloroflexi bacterium]|nr:hypothetical protein [Chloroflexota bacterium]
MAGSSGFGSSTNTPPTPTTAWQRLSGSVPVSYSTNQGRFLGQLPPPVADPNTGQVLAVVPDGSGTDRLGIWQGLQWSFSSLPTGFRAMAYDSARQQVIAVSEHQRTPQTIGPVADDSWSWDGSAWQPFQVGSAVTMYGPTSLVYDPSAQNLELVSYGPVAIEPGNGPGYSHSEFGPHGNWRVIQCGASWILDVSSWQSCGIPGVPVPTASFAGKEFPVVPRANVLGYDPRLHAVIGIEASISGAPGVSASVMAFSHGYWQPVSSGAPALPGGAWAGTYDSIDQILWIAGYTSAGTFQAYRDDNGGGFQPLSLSQTPPPVSAMPASVFQGSEQSDYLNGVILPLLSTSSLAYDPSSQQLLWLSYGNPQWTQWSQPGYGPPMGIVSLQATTWTFSTVGFSGKPTAVCIDYVAPGDTPSTVLDSRPAADYCYQAASSHGYRAILLRQPSAKQVLAATRDAAIIFFAGHVMACMDDSSSFQADGKHETAGALPFWPDGPTGKVELLIGSSGSQCADQYKVNSGALFDPRSLRGHPVVILLACLTGLNTPNNASLADDAIAAGAAAALGWTTEVQFSGGWGQSGGYSNYRDGADVWAHEFWTAWADGLPLIAAALLANDVTRFYSNSGTWGVLNWRFSSGSNDRLVMLNSSNPA